MKQILLVEDDHDIAALLRLNLEDEGYAITHEPDGGNALQRLEKQPWDAVILDLKRTARERLNNWRNTFGMPLSSI